MHVHGPNLLQGPVSRRRLWWNVSDDDIMEAMSKLPPGKDMPADVHQARRAGADTPRVADVTQNPRAADAPIRTELVERVRREIAAGTYDTPEKWEAALDRLSRKLVEE